MGLAAELCTLDARRAPVDMPSTKAIGSIGRRIDSTIAAIVARQPEEALIHLFPAMDKTAKRRRPKAGVGDRIRGFIDDQEIIITAIAFGNIMSGTVVDGMKFSEAIYKFGRTSIAHEGELDERLKIIPGCEVRIGRTWELPESTIFAMCIATMIAPENAGETSSSKGSVKVLGHETAIQDLWGAQIVVEDTIRTLYRRDVFAGV